MLNIEFKDLYKQKNIPKSLSIPFPSLGITVTNKDIVSESLELQEKICADDKLVFGACIASQLKFTVANIAEELKGQEFQIDQLVPGYDMPLGMFIVDSCPKQSDAWFKDVTAYDRMKKIEVDVAAWYNGLTFPMNQAAFRTSLLTYVGLEEDTSKLPLPNDSEMVEKTLDNPAQLSGRMVIEAIEEANGVFGHINRYGKFTHIILDKSFTDYPQDDYPESDYPEEEPYEQIEPYMYVQNDVKFEEYTVKMIDKLIIRQEENDVGAIYGTGSNAYIIQGNFLFYGKSADDLQRIAANIAKNVFNRGYRPYTADLIGLPYIEVGDTVKYQTDDTVAGYVLSRTLKGIQALRDTFEAQGSEQQTENVSGTNYEIQQLKGKSFKIEKSVDGLKQTVTDLAAGTQSKFEQTTETISEEVSRATQAEGALDGKSTVQADNITAEVTRAKEAEGTLNGKIEETAESIQLYVSQTYSTKSEVSNFSTQVTNSLSDLQNQIDGSITSWFYAYDPSVTNEPASSWATTEDKNKHLGDLFYNTDTGHVFRWQVQSDAYSWTIVTDTDVTKALADAAKAQDTADSKRRVFTDTPVPPYDAGDLWTQGASGDLYRCITARATGSYIVADWEKASKYTDDTKANEVSGQVEVLANQVVLKVDSNGKVGYVELDADPDTELTSIVIKADNIALEGIITANSNFKILADGSVEAKNGKFSGDITGSNITGSSFETTGSHGTTLIAEGDITSGYIEITADGSNTHIGISPYQINVIGPSSNTLITPDTVSCQKLVGVDTLNGATPLTSSNKNNYTYPPDTSFLSNFATRTWVSQSYQPAGSYAAANHTHSSASATIVVGSTAYIFQNGIYVGHS